MTANDNIGVYMSHNGSDYTDVTSVCAGNTGGGLSFSRGRNRVLGQWEPGRATVNFRNTTRAVDPFNQNASLFQPRLGDWLLFYDEVEEETQWVGRISSIGPITYQHGSPPPSMLTIQAADDLALLNVVTPTTSIFDSKRTGSRVDDILSDVGYAGSTDTAIGQHYISNVSETSVALARLQLVVDTEGGGAQLYMSKSGELVFNDATGGLAPSLLAVGGSGNVPIHNIIVDYTNDEFANKATVSCSDFAFLTDSSTALTVGTGAAIFTLTDATTSPADVGVLFTADSLGSSALMTGTVTAYNRGTGDCTVNITSTAGSGSHSDWVIGLNSDTTAQSAEDAQSIARYNHTRERSPVTLPLVGTGEALERAQWIASVNANPQRRVSTVVIEMGTLTSSQYTNVIALEIGDALEIRHDTGSGDPQILHQVRQIDGIARTIPGDGTDLLTFTLGIEATVNFTTLLKQNGNSMTPITVHSATYRNTDGRISADVLISIGAISAGAAGTEIKLTPTSLPAPHSKYALLTNPTMGYFTYRDQGTAIYVGTVEWDGTDIHFVSHLETDVLGVDPSIAPANTDQVSVHLDYDAAA